MTDDKEREVKCPACDGKGYAEIIEGWQRPCDACYGECFLRQPTQTDTLKIARDAICGLLDITSEYNLDSEQAGRAYAALHEIGTALAALDQSK